MPAGTVIAALAVICLVALAALFLFGESAEVGAPSEPPAAESGQLPARNLFQRAFD